GTRRAPHGATRPPGARARGGRSGEVRPPPHLERAGARDCPRDARHRRRGAHARLPATRHRRGGLMGNIVSLQVASPWVLAFFIVLPIWWLWRRRRRQPAIIFSRVPVLAVGPRVGRHTTLVLFLLRNLALASLIVAVARPRSGAHAEDVTSEGINIVLVIDLSSSMLALDFQPQNRMEVAREVVKRFVAQRTSDRIGVVAFAAEALTQVPLTTDYPVV